MSVSTYQSELLEYTKRDNQVTVKRTWNLPIFQSVLSYWGCLRELSKYVYLLKILSSPSRASRCNV